MAQSLIEQLQLGAVDGAAPITDLLRRAKLAAAKLGVADFAAWVDLELTGYADEETVPSYRRVHGHLKFLNPVRGWCPILGLSVLEQSVFQPVSELSALAKSESSFLTMTVPDEIWRMVCQNLGFNCDVKFHCSPTELHGVIEAVRNNVLEWTLKLEKAGIRGDGLSFTQAEAKAAQSMFVTNNYHGPVASVAHGTANIHTVS
jgi:hypothetical protein